MYHCSVKIISRSSGRSSVGSAAYRSGEKLTNEYDGETHDFTKKTGVVYTEIILPQNVPKEFMDRSTLWNSVEKAETRVNSQTAREVEVALPKEFCREDQIELLRGYVKKNFTDKGMCADICVHDKGTGNPHAHIMLTTRNVDVRGFTSKNREWNDRKLLEEWRKDWADQCNEMYKKKDIDKQIDHRSYKDQGIEKLPTIHLGSSASAMERRGKKTERGNINREIKLTNEQINKIQYDIATLEAERKNISLDQADHRESAADERSPEEALKQEKLVLQLKVCENRYTKFVENEDVLISQLERMDEKYQNVNAEIMRAKDAYQNTHEYNTRIKQLKEECGSLGIFKGAQKKALEAKIEEIRGYRDKVYSEYENVSGVNDLKEYIAAREEKAFEIDEMREEIRSRLGSIKEYKKDLEVQYREIDQEIKARNIDVKEIMVRIQNKQIKRKADLSSNDHGKAEVINKLIKSTNNKIKNTRERGHER